MNPMKRLSLAWKALTGPMPEPAPVPTVPPTVPEDENTLRSRLLGMEQELEVCRKEIERVRESAGAAATADAREELKDAFKRVAGPLSQLAAMRAAVEGGIELKPKDVLALAKSVETALERAGLKSLGRVDELTGFDPRHHQRMSGGDVKEGDRVKVQFPGYALAEDTLLRALVTREEKP